MLWFSWKGSKNGATVALVMYAFDDRKFAAMFKDFSLPNLDKYMVTL